MFGNVALIATAVLAAAVVVDAGSGCHWSGCSYYDPAGPHFRYGWAPNVDSTVHRPRNDQLKGWQKHDEWSTAGGTYANPGPMKAWDDADVKKVNQEYMAFALNSKPAKKDIKYIAFFVNGMQDCGGWHTPNSGSFGDWRYYIHKNHSSGLNWRRSWMKVDRRSAAQIFVDNQDWPKDARLWSYNEDLKVFPAAETLVVSIYDLAMPPAGTTYSKMGYILGLCNPTNSAEQNANIMRGWYKWLSENVDFNNIKGFFGMGFSRGGCFVSKFASMLFDGTFNREVGEKLRCNAKILLETIDPVCMPGDEIYDVKEIRAPWYGPDGSVYKCNGIDLNYFSSPFKQAWPLRLFSNVPRSIIKWRNTIVGEKVVIKGAYGLCDNGTASDKGKAQLFVNTKGAKAYESQLNEAAHIQAIRDPNIWYIQTWSPSWHGQLGGGWFHDDNVHNGAMPVGFAEVGNPRNTNKAAVYGLGLNPNPYQDNQSSWSSRTDSYCGMWSPKNLPPNGRSPICKPGHFALDTVYWGMKHAALWGVASNQSLSPDRFDIGAPHCIAAPPRDLDDNNKNDDNDAHVELGAGVMVNPEYEALAGLDEDLQDESGTPDLPPTDDDDDGVAPAFDMVDPEDTTWDSTTSGDSRTVYDTVYEQAFVPQFLVPPAEEVEQDFPDSELASNKPDFFTSPNTAYD